MAVTRCSSTSSSVESSPDPSDACYRLLTPISSVPPSPSSSSSSPSSSIASPSSHIFKLSSHPSTIVYVRGSLLPAHSYSSSSNLKYSGVCNRLIAASGRRQGVTPEMSVSQSHYFEKEDSFASCCCDSISMSCTTGDCGGSLLPPPRKGANLKMNNTNSDEMDVLESHFGGSDHCESFLSSFHPSFHSSSPSEVSPASSTPPSIASLPSEAHSSASFSSCKSLSSSLFPSSSSSSSPSSSSSTSPLSTSSTSPPTASRVLSSPPSSQFSLHHPHLRTTLSEGFWRSTRKEAQPELSGQPLLQEERPGKFFPTHAHAHTWHTGRRMGWAMLLLILQLLASTTTPAHAQVVGENMACHQEGEAIMVPKEVFKDNPCLECICEKHIVVCKKPRCPVTEGCYWKLDSYGECCQQCKGCFHEGQMYKHGAKWSEGCNHYECNSGVLTVSQTQCHYPCYEESRLDSGGQCCQKCQGCWFEGKRLSEGESVASHADPCIRCTCSNGSMTCDKKACPVLSCPPSKQVPSNDSCCMKCVGSRDLISPPGGRCFLNGHLYRTGSDRTLDPCTICTCQEGYITCERRICPLLNCSREFQITPENECCPSCSAAGERETVCRVPGLVLKHGEHWNLDECTLCQCNNGETTCHMISCEYFNKPCPRGYKRIKPENECCPRCERAPGVCSVFGDPHYLTFDGLLYNFQGAWKYTLAKTCRGGTFHLKVNNDARRSALFSWTKSLSLAVPGAKIKLGQKLRTKVNGTRVKSPYFAPGILNITREGLAIRISTPDGINILWDGASYVELEVPLEMQGDLCGLCGNFNGNVTDDLMSSDGTIAETAERMAMSWSTGKAKCSHRNKGRSCKKKNAMGNMIRRRLQRQNCPVSHSGLTQCGLLNSTVFQACHASAPIEQFYESCVLDMCECKSTRRCECDTIQAYARLCERLGIAVPGWRALSKCGGMECPHGAEYMECAPLCRPSCRNPMPDPNCYRRRCRAGCFCPPPTVLHRGTCIPASDCPRRGKKRRRNS